MHRADVQGMRDPSRGIIVSQLGERDTFRSLESLQEAVTLPGGDLSNIEGHPNARGEARCWQLIIRVVEIEVLNQLHEHESHVMQQDVHFNTGGVAPRNELVEAVGKADEKVPECARASATVSVEESTPKPSGRSILAQ